MRSRDEISKDAGSAGTIEALHLEAMLDIRDLLQQLVSQGQASTSNQKKKVIQKIENEVEQL